MLIGCSYLNRASVVISVVSGWRERIIGASSTGYESGYYGVRPPLVTPSPWPFVVLLCCFTLVVSCANYSMGLIGAWVVVLALVPLFCSLLL